MFFKTFQNWNKKSAKIMEKKYPFLSYPYINASMVKSRLDNFAQKNNITKGSDKYYNLLSFYLGAIEGYLREIANMSELTMDGLVEAMYITGCYVAMKDNEVSNENETDNLVASFQKALLQDKEQKFRKYGLGYATDAFEDSSDACWSKAIDKLLSKT